MKGVRKYMKDKEEAELLTLFKQYDLDQSGELGSAEIIYILEDFDLLPKTREEQDEIKAILAEIDIDGSGNLGFDEFQMLMQRVRQQLQRLQRDQERECSASLGFNDDQMRDFRKAFETLDPDGSGSLTIGDVRQVMRLLHQNISSDELRDIFEQLDEDVSGEMEFCEFLHFMKLVEDGKDQLKRPAKCVQSTHERSQMVRPVRLSTGEMSAVSTD